MYNLKVNRGENCDNKKHDESLKKKTGKKKGIQNKQYKQNKVLILVGVIQNNQQLIKLKINLLNSPINSQRLSELRITANYMLLIRDKPNYKDIQKV